mgnify:CR=1 FL=1
MENKKFFVQDEQGNEIEYEIVLTFEHPDTKVNYVIYKELGDTEDVMAAIYDEKSDNAGALLEIQTEEEFEMIQDVLDAFMDEDEE